MAQKPKPETEKAFDAFCADPLVIEAVSKSGNVGACVALIRYAFMAGAKYAVDRCKAQGH